MSDDKNAAEVAQLQRIEDALDNPALSEHDKPEVVQTLANAYPDVKGR